MRNAIPGDSMDVVTVMVVPGRSGSIRRFQLRRRLLRQLAVGSAVLVLATGALVIDYVRVRLDVVELARLQNVSQKQAERLEEYSGRIETISGELARLHELDHKLRVIADLDPGDELPLTGVGGIEGEGLEGHFLSGLTRDQRHARFLGSLDGIRDAGERQQRSFEDLIEKLETRTAQLAHTPSIAPTRGWITSEFGYRLSPFTQQRELHRGLDIAGRLGTPIIAPASGRVRFAGRDRGLGNAVILRHGYGVETIYGHLEKVLVHTGQEVKRGDRLGLMGSTGHSTGPHLHYQVSVNGVAVNPRNYILD
ncbi:MAG: M23 family metallopeptidase [Myxococcota bacterium]